MRFAMWAAAPACASPKKDTVMTEIASTSSPFLPAVSGYPTLIADTRAALAACERACRRGTRVWASDPPNNRMAQSAALAAQAEATCAATLALLAREDLLTVSEKWLQLRMCVAACVACAMECEKYENGHWICRACAAACRHCEVSCRALMGRL